MPCQKRRQLPRELFIEQDAHTRLPLPDKYGRSAQNLRIAVNSHGNSPAKGPGGVHAINGPDAGHVARAPCPAQVIANPLGGQRSGCLRKTCIGNLDAQVRRGAYPPKVSSPCTSSANDFALAIFAGLLERNTAHRTEEPMAGVIFDLKAQARILHREVRAGEPLAVARVQGLEELRGQNPTSVTAQIRRRHCLTVIARELGFQGWPHAVAVLRGADSSDFGTLLYPKGAHVHWNIWSASYDEAQAIREQHGGYLLAYRRHFFITDRYFIETLGLDPDDRDWELIGRDWVRPRRTDARERLYGKLIRRRTMGTKAA